MVTCIVSSHCHSGRASAASESRNPVITDHEITHQSATSHRWCLLGPPLSGSPKIREANFWGAPRGDDSILAPRRLSPPLDRVCAHRIARQLARGRLLGQLFAPHHCTHLRFP